MNSEVESSRLKITRTGTHAHVQAITPRTHVHTGRKNSRVVAHDHQPPPPPHSAGATAHGGDRR